MIKPPKLQAGDKVATVSLSWGGPCTYPHRYQAGVEQLQAEFDLQVVPMEHTMKDADWLWRNPRARADDLMAAFSDASIKGIISTIGGEDSIRIVPFLDFKVMQANPKVFLGYSDTTISHLACYQAGLISFYGPAIMAGFAENGGLFPYMIETLRRTLFSSDPIGEIKVNMGGWTVETLDWAEPENQSRRRKLEPSTGWKFINGKDTARGHLIGGCIEVIDWLRGHQLFPTLDQWEGAILFLETSEDAPPPSQVKYVLRNLAAMGILERLSGMLFGRPGGGVSQDKFGEYDEAILHVLRDEEGLDELPVVSNMDFGHTDPMFVLPYGVQAEIDCERGKFTILENAVAD